MFSFNSVSQKVAGRIARSALGVLLLTSLHHAYGAYIYHTPWRLHVVFVSLLTAAGIIGAMLALRRWPGNVAGKIAFWVFTVLTFVIPVAVIGFFEGGYNHAVKDALYFAGGSASLMRRLFPAPVYELPNDLFFEVTGVLQLVPAIITGRLLYRFVRGARRTPDARADQTLEHRSYA